MEDLVKPARALIVDLIVWCFGSLDENVNLWDGWILGYLRTQ